MIDGEKKLVMTWSNKGKKVTYNWIERETIKFRNQYISKY